MNRIVAEKQRIKEGELRCQDLKDYLTKINAPLTVYISEDASGIIKKVVYDARSNQLIGLVLPTNQYGMPQVSSCSS